MVILTAEHLTKSFADRTLFEGLSFGLNDTDRVGLIGVNGSGKTTLLRVLAGLEPIDSGRITLGGDVRVAYLPQNPLFEGDTTVLDYVFAADTPTMHLLREYEALTARLEREPTHSAFQDRLHDLTEQMERLGAWETETNAHTILSRLGIDALEATLGTLSGGQRKRVAMARALIDPVELLILDEPTNHIDVDTVAWLEEYLARMSGALLLVTHDRYFLDRVTNRIFELENRGVFTYEGNYEAFLVGRQERDRLASASALKQQNLLRKEMVWLQRGARARTTKQKAHIQRVEALAESVQNAPDPRAPLTIALGSRRLGKRAIQIRHLSKAWDGAPVIRDFTYEIEPGDRIGIVGPNGAGKTTLLDIITGQSTPDAGEVIIGETVHLAYYDQESHDLPNDKRVLEYIQEGASLIKLADGTKVSASGMLEWFLFPPEQQYNFIAKLSGGEKRRLYLLRTLMEQPNIILLDEPTNDLDIQTLTVLEDFLDQFAGTVVAVSHDRYFLDRVTDFLLVFEGDGTIREYPGNYALYREMQARERSEAQAEVKAEVKRQAASQEEKPRRLTSKEKRELEAIEARMALLEARVPQIDAEMVVAATDYSKLATLQNERNAAEKELEQLMERWLELDELR
ncbi:MAG: ABC-F family ATP-binding cassette domain-containing protein [Ardenticatenales bacterium]|nr:ABC-F family ATP-binding cassette domain-containing protein [Ardenticatenales bacterium]